MTVRLAQPAMNKNACQNQPQFNFLVGILPPVIFRSLAVLAMLAWCTPATRFSPESARHFPGPGKDDR